MFGLVILLTVGLAEGAAMGDSDRVMASAEEIQQVLDWASVAFAGIKPPVYAPRVALDVVRQDHSVLNFGRSCIETPIIIGSRHFEHGLGTHANSEIAATVPKGAKAFKAWVGIDNNLDTQGTRGTVVFSVEGGGKELFRSDVLHGGAEPVSVAVDLPAGTDRIVLKVDATPDGVSHDQADWADAQFVLENGEVIFLDAKQSPLLFRDLQPPFSFTYGGVSSKEFLKGWQCSPDVRESEQETQCNVVWTDPATQLQVTANVRVYKQYPAVDWVVYFENRALRTRLFWRIFRRWT